MFIDRIIFQHLKRSFTQFPAIVVTGSRQTGKTTAVRHIFPDASYVALDFFEEASQATKDPHAFLERFPEPLIIDEIQYAPELLRSLKTVIDQHRHPGRFILTGSQPFQLMEGVSESLSGRACILNMPTLMTHEILAVRQGSRFSFRDCLLLGGFPELHANTEVDPLLWFPSYLTTYIERDIRNLLHVANLADFSQFMRLLATRSGQLLNIADVAKDIGIAPNTAKKWLSLLETSGQVTRLEPYYRNMGKRMVKSPKIYFNDSGLLSYLLGIQTQEQLMATPLIGGIWETFVFGEIMKSFWSIGQRPSIWFWRNYAGDEVDFLIEHGGIFTLIEAKFTARPQSRDMTGFEAFTETYGAKAVSKKIVASSATSAYPLENQIIVQPGWEWEPEKL